MATVTQTKAPPVCLGAGWHFKQSAHASYRAAEECEQKG